ncbi:MaoC/PaaZ C-terminal domain-containing protein [Chryseobacterium formosus]|uniref:MaoC/PaaZ C-terminal domain-containing protein n=1 Tax=Chryseobacterium formosus TaxID=1537363 RepID=A0ABT3XJL2_9FLAO|nr:MaoC/PaaZ C-terminal domain-containing protein [Chryseobacterium formosus]MCX8522338.1 MaoC/PaaZ C-terminal domain-containing protein [Chryseobacterium formosus]
MVLQLNQKFQHQFQVDDKIYNGFISVFEDKNALHTNEEFAQNKGFKSKVMHGNILNGFLSFFIGELLPTENVMILSQNINFKNPVYLNDILNFEAIIEEQSEAVYVNIFKFKFINNENKIVATGRIQIKELT